MTGAELFLFLADGGRVRLRVRDLSQFGVSGRCEVDLSPGEPVLVQLEEMLMPDATVIWASNGVAGLSFDEPVAAVHLRRIGERHIAGAAWSPAMRAGSDLHGWWTDMDAHAEGRLATLDAGGHAFPLPR